MLFISKFILKLYLVNKSDSDMDEELFLDILYICKNLALYLDSRIAFQSLAPNYWALFKWEVENSIMLIYVYIAMRLVRNSELYTKTSCVNILFFSSISISHRKSVLIYNCKFSPHIRVVPSFSFYGMFLSISNNNVKTTEGSERWP